MFRYVGTHRATSSNRSAMQTAARRRAIPFSARFDDRPLRKAPAATALSVWTIRGRPRSSGRPPCCFLYDAELLRVDVPRARRRTPWVSVPNRNLEKLGIGRCYETTRQRLLHAPLVGGVANASTRPESFAAEVVKRNVLRVHDGVAVVACIALNQNRSGARVRAHERQQRASMLELGRDGRPQQRVPVANLPRERIHRVENRERQPE